MVFSLFKNRLAKTSSRYIDIDKYLSIIKNDKTKVIIDKIRAGEVIELPAVTFAGVFNTRKKEACTCASGFVMADIDGLNGAVKYTKELLGKDKHIVLCHYSKSGEGLRLLFYFKMLEGKAGEEASNMYTQLFGVVERYIADEYGIEIDKSCKDISRLSFISYDVDYIYNPDADELIVIEPSDYSAISNEISNDGVTIDNGNLREYLYKKVFKRASELSVMPPHDGKHRLSVYLGALGNITGIEISQLKSIFAESWVKWDVVQYIYSHYASQFGSKAKERNKDKDKDKNKKEKIAKTVIEVVNKLTKHSYYKYIRNNQDVSLVAIRNGVIVEYYGDGIMSHVTEFIVDKFPNINIEDVMPIAKKTTEAIHLLHKLNENTIYNNIKDKLKESYLFFQDYVVRIDADNITAVSYSDFPYLLWDGQKINRSFTPNGDTSVYERFVRLVAGNDEARYDYLRWCIGYILSGVNDTKNRKLVMLTDFTENEKEKGGTGKSLLTEAFKYVRNTVTYDGKKFDTGNYSFQLNTEGTEVIVIDDIKMNTIESLYSVITNGLQINKKYARETYIPASQYKIVATANYIFRIDDNSTLRRLYIHKCNNSHFKGGVTPYDYFGHMLYHDWDDAEWNRFYTYIISLIQYYLANKDRDYSAYMLSDNSNELLLKEIGGQQMIEALDELEVNTTHSKSAIISKLKSYGINLSVIALTKRLSAYCRWKGYQLINNTKTGTYIISSIQGQDNEIPF